MSDPETKLHQYAYEKHLNRRILQERANKLALKQDLDKEKTEQEVREYSTRSAVAVATRSKDKGKGVLQSPSSPSLCRMEDMLEKGVELNINFEKMGSELYLFKKEKREEEAREHATSSAAAVGAQSENKGTGVLEGPLSPSLTAIEVMSEKGE